MSNDLMFIPIIFPHRGYVLYANGDEICYSFNCECINHGCCDDCEIMLGYEQYQREDVDQWI